MKSQAELEDLRDTMGAMVEMGDNGPFSPEMRDSIAAVWNALCYVLEDGSPHAATFERNWTALMKWCDVNGVRFIKLPGVQTTNVQ
jgi:hypothetical protein